MNTLLIAIERDYNLTIADQYAIEHNNEMALKHYSEAANLHNCLFTGLLLNNFEIDLFIQQRFLN